MTATTKVALAGASGNMGAVIMQALLATNKYSITALTRQSSSGTKFSFPPEVVVAEVDYTSLPSLTAALKDHTILISTLTSSALQLQHTLIDAAVAAGVSRIIPSEFGSDTLNPLTCKFPVYGYKVAVQEHLVRVAEETGGEVSYTLVLNSLFFDYGLEIGFPVDLKNKKADLYDGGDRRFSTTTLASVAQAVVGVLKHLDMTRNRAVRVHDAVITQKQIIGYAEKNGGAKFETRNVDLRKVLQESYEGLEKGNVGPAMMGFIKVAILGEGYGGEFQETDNELLGLKGMTDVELEAEVVRVMKMESKGTITNTHFD